MSSSADSSTPTMRQPVGVPVDVALAELERLAPALLEI
jgi:hypothetical protein